MPTTQSFPERSCPYCGRPLVPRTARLMGRTVFFGFEDCGCEGERRAREQQERREREQERAEADRNLERLVLRTGVPQRYSKATHDRAKEVADALVGGRNAYLCGPVGTGKTTCMAAAARELVRRFKSPRFARVGDILGEVERAFRTDRDVIGEYARYPILMLDDLGKEQPTAFTLSRLFSLVDSRYGSMLPTCVTTQYSPRRLVERLSERGDADTAQAIVSRLTQDALGIEFNGKDLRISR